MPKPSTKQRRTQVKIELAANDEELKQKVDLESAQRFSLLQHQLEVVRKVAANNRNAADIFSGFVSSGEMLIENYG